MCGSSSSFLDINEKEDIIRVFAHTHTTGKKTEGAEGELWPGLGPNAGEAWITMRQCPWNLRALS